ncbi:transposase domain containing protein [Nephila pilipes]|uniref:Transposase domain containing protein n=1 Tax=Nephila pilipes TaxID=299642 RepID=A0A8X6U9L7_NEPPI|nr:transposase domain containing protein [Nephila pilipes]
MRSGVTGYVSKGARTDSEPLSPPYPEGKTHLGWQLRVQRPPIRNISDLRDRCLNIWYNLSPVIYQGLVASMPRRVEAVLLAKGGPTRY